MTKESRYYEILRDPMVGVNRELMILKGTYELFSFEWVILPRRVEPRIFYFRPFVVVTEDGSFMVWFENKLI